MTQALLSRHPARLAALLLLVALAIRAWDFGNPVIHVDEQYYLLVGDRMLRGAVPYIDIWDRKPVGLFLLYAAIRLLPGDGILAYQIVATLFAAATAFIVHRGAQHIGATGRGALAAAAAYLLWLSLLGGRGGQSPVFYNLLMAAAAVMTLRLPDLAEARRTHAIVTNGAAACLLAGMAIQMKYTPAFEGAFFGMAHLWWFRRAGPAPARLLAAATLWLVCGLAPSLAAIAGYAHLGPVALHAFWFANFTSITLRPPYPGDQIFMRLIGIAALLSPLLAAAALGWRWRPRGRSKANARAAIALGWLVSALIGFGAIGTFFDHYALPLLAPLALIAARAFARSTRVAIGALTLASMLFAIQRVTLHDDAPRAREVARTVADNSRGGCPYVFIGDTITYLLADACLPTAYAFPNLLSYATEQGATGIDEAAEVRRILANRPPVIVASDRRLAIWNKASVRALRAALVGYRPILAEPRAGYRTIVYLRRDLPVRR